MNNHTFRRSSRKREEGSILLEALMASAILTLVAATIAPLFSRQLELARRTRNLDLVEAVVSRDINTFRHYSRFWKAFSGPYSGEIMKNEITLTQPSTQNNGQRPMTYTPEGYCFTWNDRDYLERSMSSDISSYAGSMPGGIDLGLSQGVPYKKFTEVPGYEIRRFMGSVSTSGFNAIAIRLSYRVVALGSSPPLPFNRVAEVPIEAQFWC